MKKTFLSILTLLALVLNGCIKNNPPITKEFIVELDAASWNANSLGVNYPIMTLVPNSGVAGGGASLTRSTGTFNLRVNLIGAQRSTATNFSYQVVTSETTAIAGTHYTSLSGTGTIPANSSFGTISVPLLNPGVSSTTPVVLVMELVSNADAKASLNYGKIGFRISQL
jgi:Domain of unknown function (DUF4843)